VREVYDRAQAYPGPDPKLPGLVQQAQRVKQQREYEQELWALCQPHVKTSAPMSVLCQRVERFLPEWFTFAAEPQVPANNNAAERSPSPEGRSPRPPVVSRKVSGGTRSEQGSETKSVLVLPGKDKGVTLTRPFGKSSRHPKPPSLNSCLYHSVRDRDL